MEVPTDRRGRAPPHFGHGLLDHFGKRAAVGVTEHERLGSGFLGRREDRERELRVPAVAVEEVLGVEEDAEARLAQVRHRIGRHGDRLVERGSQRLGDVQVGGLRDDADHLRARFDEVAERLVTACLCAGTARRAEGDERRCLESQLLHGSLEELLVLRVRTGPATLDVRDAQMVELLSNAQLVVDGE